MIERLSGTCVTKHPASVVVDVQGVGYAVEMTPAGIASLTEGEAAIVWIHMHVTEGSLRLFGFPTLSERQVFSLLLTVSGLGPKIGMAILAQLDPARLVEIVERDAAEELEDVPGIGARQSQKFILELKPKLAKLAAAGWRTMGTGATAAPDRSGAAAGKSASLGPAMLKDLQSALENFGYKEKELASLLRKFDRQPPATSLAELVRLALKELTVGTAEVRNAEDLF